MIVKSLLRATAEPAWCASLAVGGRGAQGDVLVGQCRVLEH